MQDQYLNSLKELDYANLTKEEQDQLRELENKFNNNINKQVYFMVMER
ncbi:polynucleotide phosphorylase [Crassaminicella profunda]|nr:polynucleotide phosphorylase [Crassaminicella profunda]QZY56224.1 polynucleotide phosphorylase [Crassaminicella profunda]